jgi:hypothetical protein
MTFMGLRPSPMSHCEVLGYRMSRIYRADSRVQWKCGKPRKPSRGRACRGIAMEVILGAQVLHCDFRLIDNVETEAVFLTNERVDGNYETLVFIACT